MTNNDTAKQLNYTVQNIITHPLYPNLGYPDIALIRIVETLPVNAVVQIPRVEDSLENCSVIVRNSGPNGDYFKLVSNFRIAPKELCGITITDDDCSMYPMDADWCQVLPQQLFSSNDLGSALICNNVFRGVLSNIFTPDPYTAPCGSPRTTFARYTSLEENDDWLYLVMGYNKPVDPDDEDSGAIPHIISVGVTLLATFVSMIAV